MQVFGKGLYVSAGSKPSLKKGEGKRAGYLLSSQVILKRY